VSSAVEKARRGLRIYLVSLLVITVLLTVPDRILEFLLPGDTFLLVRSLRRLYASAPSFVWFIVGWFAPAMASFIARQIQDEGFDDVSFRLRGNWTLPAIGIAWLWPVGAGLAVYGLAWLSGVTRFHLVATWPPFGSWGPEQLVGISLGGIPLQQAFITRLIASLLFVPFYGVVVFGQELGWRGYMLTRLIDAKVPAPIFWNGLAWGLSYMPILFRPSPTASLEAPWISYCFEVAGMIAISYLLAYLRLRSGSIWPAVLGASGMVVLFLSFDAFTWANPFWKGELYLLSLGLTTAVVLFFPPPWAAQPILEPEAAVPTT
jgi:uncharacterized protein